MTMSERIVERLAARRMTVRELAERIGTSTTSVRSWTTGLTPTINSKFLLDMCAELDCDARWLVEGAEGIARRPGFVRIPVFSPKAVLNQSITNNSWPNGDADREMSFPAEFFSRHGRDHRCIYGLVAADEAMAPFIGAGDIVLVDASDSSYDGVCAIRQRNSDDASTMLRYVDRLFDGKLLIHAQNPDKKRFRDLAAVDPADVHLLGRAWYREGVLGN